MATTIIAPDPKLPAARTRYYRLSKIDPEKLTDVDRAWKGDYEGARAEKRSKERVIHIEERQDEEAIATGDGLDAAPLLAREEGRRLDYLIERAVEGLSRTIEYQQAFMDMLLTRTGDLMQAQAALVDALSTTKLQMADAEAQALIAAATGGDEEGDAIGQFINGFAKGAASRKAPRRRKRPTAADVRAAVEAGRAKTRRNPE